MEYFGARVFDTNKMTFIKSPVENLPEQASVNEQQQQTRNCKQAPVCEQASVNEQ